MHNKNIAANLRPSNEIEAKTQRVRSSQAGVKPRVDAGQDKDEGNLRVKIRIRE
mgnify:CR=1 FL=1